MFPKVFYFENFFLLFALLKQLENLSSQNFYFLNQRWKWNRTISNYAIDRLVTQEMKGLTGFVKGSTYDLKARKLKSTDGLLET